MKKRNRDARGTTRRYSNKPLFHKSIFLLAILTSLAITVFGVIRSQYFDERARGEVNRPNVIVVMTDDQRADTLSYMTNVQNRLVSQGVTFTNSFATTPLCCPSRTSFLTGMYAHNHGVLTNNKDQHGGYSTFMQQNHDPNTIAVWLRDGGYKTSYIGKYLNGYGGNNHIPPGWDDWHVFSDPQYYDYNLIECTDCQSGNVAVSRNHYGKNDDKYSTDVLKAKAKTFLQTTTEPFFLVFEPKAPHGGGGQEDGLNNPDLPARHKGTCDPISPKNLGAYNESPVSDKTKWIREKNKLGADKKRDIERFATAQVCSLKAVDEAINEMLDVVGEERLNNTVVIFTSDNGYTWGEHRYTGKNCLYDPCAKVPLVIAYPQVTASAFTSDQLVTNLDLVATILELAGVPIPTQVDGKSFVPLLTDANTSLQDTIFLEVWSTSKTSPTGSAVRTKEYKYIEYNRGGREFYDLLSDPSEENNQIRNPAFAPIIQNLSTRLSQLKQE
ncbi:MAG: sulfatase [Candidatus Levybacteria bacterium]|nr:sulfatase [Candidatus Levybacteria bacterium]